MREILFRGFTPDKNAIENVFVKGQRIKGQWLEGNYISTNKTTYCYEEDYLANPDNTEHFIIFDRMTDWGLPNRHMKAIVLPETVGQYTGLTDKNGAKIFEGDICRHFANYPGKNIYAPIVFELGMFWLKYSEKAAMPLCDVCEKVEVVGNIHDNPELLKGAEE